MLPLDARPAIVPTEAWGRSIIQVKALGRFHLETLESSQWM